MFPNGCLFLLDNHIIPLTYHPMSNLPVFQLLPTPQAQAMLSQIPLHGIDQSSSHLLWGFTVMSQQQHSDTLPFETTLELYDNWTAPQQQLYDWHVRLGHMNFVAIQQHSLQKLWPVGEWPLQPGEMCCVDQMIAGCPGLPYTAHGHCSSWCYTSCTFFVNVTTWHIFPHFQESTNALSSDTNNTVNNIIGQYRSISQTMVSSQTKRLPRILHNQASEKWLWELVLTIWMVLLNASSVSSLSGLSLCFSMQLHGGLKSLQRNFGLLLFAML